MSGTQLLHRVRCWFGGRHEETPGPSVAEDTSKAVLFAGSGGGAAPSRSSPVPRSDPQHEPAPTVFPLHALAPARPREPQVAPGADGAWPQAEPPLARLLEDLPQRIARAVAGASLNAPPLGDMAAELRGHRETGRAIAQAVGRLPDIGTSQVELLRRSNQLAERHTRVAESLLDELAALRGAFRGVEESSRRNLKCFMEIEATHREVLAEYQEELLIQHRRLYRLTILAVLLAAAALGGMVYTLNTVLHP